MKTVLVTGSSGLIGSEAVTYFDDLGATVHGIDNNMRADFFGPGGDTTWNRRRLESTCKRFKHHEVDIRDRERIFRFFEEVPLDLVVRRDGPRSAGDDAVVNTLALKHFCPLPGPAGAYTLTGRLSFRDLFAR